MLMLTCDQWRMLILCQTSSLPTGMSMSLMRQCRQQYLQAELCSLNSTSTSRTTFLWSSTRNTPYVTRSTDHHRHSSKQRWNKKLEEDAGDVFKKKRLQYSFLLDVAWRRAYYIMGVYYYRFSRRRTPSPAKIKITRKAAFCVFARISLLFFDHFNIFKQQ